MRKRSGTELETLATTKGPNRRVSIQPEDATLEEVDLDDLDSHRSDDPRAFRRKKSSRTGSLVHISRKNDKSLNNVLSAQALKKMYDHSPHAVSSTKNLTFWKWEEHGRTKIYRFLSL